MRPEPAPAGEGLYGALLELSTEAIARFELQPAMRVDLAPDDQVAHVLRHARIAQCNEAYARLYDRSAPEMTGRTVAEVIPEAERREVIGHFVASGYRRARADAVLARLGRAAYAARAWVAESLEDPDGSPRIVFRFTWGARGYEVAPDDPRIRGGISTRRVGLERIEGELRGGRPLVVDV